MAHRHARSSTGQAVVVVQLQRPRWPSNVGPAALSRTAIAHGLRVALKSPKSATGSRTPVLTDDGAKHPKAVSWSVQVADAVPTGQLKAGYLHHVETCFGDSDVDQRLDLEPVAPQSAIPVFRSWRRPLQLEHG